MKELLEIQRFSLYDGEGIRTTVFLKGCPLRCPWCANPENLKNMPYFYVDEDVCMKKGGKCLLNDDCHGGSGTAGELSRFYANCRIGAIKSFGRYFTPDEVIEIVLKDRGYFEDDGGVTFSGGEPLLHVEFLDDLCCRLKQEGIGIGFETSLFVTEAGIALLKNYADFCFVDVKILDRTLCRKVLGGDIELFLANIEKIKDIRDRVVFRIPIVPGYTDFQKNLELIRNLILDFRPLRVEILGVHNLAREKYQRLGMEFTSFEEPEKEELVKIREFLGGNVGIMEV